MSGTLIVITAIRRALDALTPPADEAVSPLYIHPARRRRAAHMTPTGWGRRRTATTGTGDRAPT